MQARETNKKRGGRDSLLVKLELPSDFNPEDWRFDLERDQGWEGCLLTSAERQMIMDHFGGNGHSTNAIFFQMAAELYRARTRYQ